jgi:ribonuclease HII
MPQRNTSCPSLNFSASSDGANGREMPEEVSHKRRPNYRCTLRLENQLCRSGFAEIAGIDEAGRGPLAGPVVAAAVILPPRFTLQDLNDSKQLNLATREAIYLELIQHPKIVFGIGVASVEEIDRVNILQATYLAMQRAVTSLGRQPQHLLIDGRPVPTFAIPQTAVVDGDAKSRSIAAASVIAKVMRDRIMTAFHEQYPLYEFAQHKGYATPEHLRLLDLHGPCPLHRKSFSPVAQTLFPFFRAATNAETNVRKVGRATSRQLPSTERLQDFVS